jgi:hypothetical protein
MAMAMPLTNGAAYIFPFFVSLVQFVTPGPWFLITSFGVVVIINVLAIMGLEWRDNDKLYILYLYGILLLSILFVPGRMREFLPPLIGLF